MSVFVTASSEHLRSLPAKLPNRDYENLYEYNLHNEN